MLNRKCENVLNLVNRLAHRLRSAETIVDNNDDGARAGESSGDDDNDDKKCMSCYSCMMKASNSQSSKKLSFLLVTRTPFDQTKLRCHVRNRYSPSTANVTCTVGATNPNVSHYHDGKQNSIRPQKQNVDFIHSSFNAIAFLGRTASINNDRTKYTFKK